MLTAILSADYFRIFKYFTNWSFVLFLIWYMNETSRKYIHIELLVSVIFYGYLLIYLLYYLVYKKKEYSFLFLFFNIIYHYIPFKIITEKSKISQKSVLFFIVCVALYLFFLSYHSKTPMDVYFNDKKIRG